jgi:hypothetical protein
MIYPLVFADHVNHIPIYDHRRDKAIAPGLIMACKQLHEEALGAFYITAKFEIGDSNGLYSWGVQVGKERTMLVREILVGNAHQKYYNKWKTVAHQERFTLICEYVRVDPKAEVWHRTGPHSDLYDRRRFYLWTKDPKKDEKAWRTRCFRPLGAYRHASLEAIIAHSKAQAEFGIDVPSWILEYETTIRQDTRRQKREVRTFWSTS